MKKNAVYILLFVVVILAAGYLLFSNNKQTLNCSSESYAIQCYDSEFGNVTKEKISCSSDNDCQQASMDKTCNPGYANVLLCINAKYFCDDGICKGCNCGSGK